ncbi:MAG: adenine nucleotide alpha hydrolase family protein [Clostridia bacterium]|nr:adenine nucleotide alpha hydrolase family protein [Clostridia bacterium]
MGKSDIKRVLGSIRRADEKFGLIENGDKIAVGISGGKDSLMLLFALSIYKKFCKKDFELLAITVDLGFKPFDTSRIEEFAKSLGIEYIRVESEIGEVVFSIRKEKNPCALCANMRRGALNSAAKENGCNKVALAHHADDAIETLIMSLFFEGRMNTFSPRTYLSRIDLTVIRPFVFVPESILTGCANDNELPITNAPCPIDGKTSRQDIKDLISTLQKTYPDIKEKLLHALDNTETYNLWDKYVADNKE